MLAITSIAEKKGDKVQAKHNVMQIECKIQIIHVYKRNNMNQCYKNIEVFSLL